MGSALPPVKRFRFPHEESQSGITDTLHPKSILPAKKRIEPQRDHWLPDLNLPASSYCLPAKKRVWAVPPLSPVKLTGIFTMLNEPEGEEKLNDSGEEKAPPIWGVRKRRTEKLLKNSLEKHTKRPAKEKKIKIEERGKSLNVDEPEGGEDPETTKMEEEEVGQAEEIVNEQRPLAGSGEIETEAEAAPQVEETAVGKVSRTEAPLVEEIPQVHDSRKEAEQGLIEIECEEEVPQIEEKVEEEELKVEEEFEKEAPTTEVASEAAKVCIEEDDGIMCAVCRSADGDPEDPIVFCDGCDLMVHSSCYGNPLSDSIPEGDWFCARCLAEKADGGGSRAGRWCCLCPAAGGVTKPTTDGRWAHVLCALLVPEVFFHDPAGRDGVDLSRVPAKRWKHSCCICRKSEEGCVVDCSESKCGLGFHVSCAMDADLCVEYRPGKAGDIVVGFCPDHTELWKKSTGKFTFVPRN